WLSLELARHLGATSPGAGDGVAANIQHAFPGALRGAVLAAGRPADVADPWAVERLTWAVLEELVADEASPALGLVATGRGASRYGRARRIADLFDRYHVHRPAMIREWAGGGGAPVAPHQQWQPRLWRAVRARIGSPSPAEQMRRLLAEVADGSLALALPHRVSVFGVSVLPGGSGFLELAAAVAASREVDLYLIEPSPALARTIRSAVRGTHVPGPKLRSTEPAAEQVENPLLLSWARLPREASVLVADLDVDHYELDVGEVPLNQTGTLLSCVQADLLANRAPSANVAFNVSDRSIQLHVAHGATRQVEVLRDAILHLLATDASLTEDDIVVVCPDLDRFAPLLEAGFGRPASAPPSTDPVFPPVGADHAPALRWRLSDRSLRNASPLVSATAALLDVVAGRFDVVSVLDAVALPAVRERYRFSEDDLGRFGDWVSEANIRWGLDPEHREPFGVPAAVTANTWRAGLHRLLLGAAVMADEPGFALGGIVPVPVGEDDMDRVGRLADLIGRLDQLVQLTCPVNGEEPKRPVPEWIDAVRALVAGTLAAARDDAWQVDALEQVFTSVVGDATVAGEPTAALITFTDLRRLLSAHLVGGAGRGDFFRGGITVTSLDPMRWIPHRVVAVLGIDQSAFASSATDGDDLAALAPVVGDRDPRAEGRQAVLEAVLAAGEHLVLTRDGHDLTTNQEIPPAVIVAELRDALMATVTAETKDALAAGFETHHPRQPYDVRCLQPGELGTAGPWAFDPNALAGAEARREQPVSAPQFLAAPLAPPNDATVVSVDLAELHRVIADAGAAFLSRRLELRLPRPGDSPSVILPVELGGLEGYAVGDRLLRGRLDGDDPAVLADLERAAGSLP
ncbi:MAG: exodeoxyribonuclease V subunit gamma, partial [Aquihabitans sp.]